MRVLYQVNKTVLICVSKVAVEMNESE